MNVRISTDFKFSVSSISYAPNGELLITLSSPESRGGSRYEYAADLGSGSAVEKPSVSLAGYSRGYVEKSRIKEKSKDPYRQLVKYLERYGDTTVDRVTTEYLQDFIAFMQASGLSDGTVRLYFQKLACVLHNAYREGLFDDRVLQRVQRVRRPREKKCFLSEQELRKMVRARRHGRSEKTESMFLFSCLTGLRFGDVTSLKWRDVKRDGRRMRLEFTQHKTGTQESLPLCECAEALLRVTDPTGSIMRYTYDFAGRLVSVLSPLSNSPSATLTNSYFPINYYSPGYVLPSVLSSHPYSLTCHRDDSGNTITETVVITDGFGRVIQTKKGITSGGQQKRQVSGRVVTDPFGRTVKQYDPETESLSISPGTLNTGVTPASLTETRYDVMDRAVWTRTPLGYVTTTAYGIVNVAAGQNRFTVAVTDPNGHTTTQYSDYEGRQVQVSDAAGGVTSFEYDALGQLLSSADPEGFTTEYEYDQLGRLTSRDHPDAGLTEYTYDAAGNMTQETNPLGHIYYRYSYRRLTQKIYSGIFENNVKYTYGTTGFGKSRPIIIEDGSGVRELSYDALGNVVTEVRSIAVPGLPNVYRFTTEYEYDSWGRMTSMTYPDGEQLTYGYCYGGDLASLSGDKGLDHYDYVTDITYNDFGQRSRVDYGNNSYTTYAYDVQHRLSLLTSVSATDTMQHIHYTTDGVGNIGTVHNSVAALSGLGGQYTNAHTYDALNRLTHSETPSLAMNVAGTYQLNMRYSPSGRLDYNDASAVSATPVNHYYHYGYCDDYQPHAPRRMYSRTTSELKSMIWDGAGNLGIVHTALNNIYDNSRFLFWTEDNRLHTVVDDEHHSYYVYDHAGERTLKLTGKNTIMDVNAELMNTSSILSDLTLYPSPYMVLTDRGYTKHYYIGSDRLCARIGGGGLEQPIQEPGITSLATGLYEHCETESEGRELVEGDLNCIYGILWDDDILRTEVRDAPVGLKVTTTINLSTFDNRYAYYTTHNDPETTVYFYHSDHLGSASWITDGGGLPVQHLQYLPFGETFVNQHTAGYEERFTFTGKEKDSETGYYYFGARYYDSDLSGLFLSVDPMADKYPSISPYAYCAWNPVKLVDPDGNEIGDYYTISGQYLGWDNKNDGNVYFVDDKESLKKFVRNKVVSSDDIKVAYATTKKELQEAVEVYKRSRDKLNQGQCEEGAIVSGDQAITAKRGTSESIDLPAIPTNWDKEKVTSIHLHAWALDTEKNNYHMATTMGPCDIDKFGKYQRNIIVGNIPGDIDGPKTISGIPKPQIGVAMYDRNPNNNRPSIVLSLDVVKKIISRIHE